VKLSCRGKGMEAATLSAVRKAKEKLENGKETH
jgi:hypothetical protein